MRLFGFRALLLGAFFSVSVPAAAVRAQASDAPSLTEVVQRLRQSMVTSGLTAEQIRGRLSAAGLGQDLLDPYYPGTPVRLVPPTPDVYLAIRNLGLMDAAELAYLQRYTPASADSARAPVTSGDSARLRAQQAMESQRAAIRADVNDSLARRDSGYNIFGLETFRSAAGRFEPTLYGPVDENYRLGPGDQLVLILTGDVESTMTLEVAREGFVLIPQVGQLYVANLTLAQLEDLLYTRLGRVYSGIRRGPNATTRFSVTISRLRTNQIFVLGDIDRPGSYQVSSAGTAIAALYAAGGPAPNGSFRNIEVKRGNRVVSTLDLYDYLLRGDASRDPRLETGDIIFVPPRGLRVRIVGEVLRPATYELKPSETLADLIRAAGGFRAEASRRLIQIERIVPAEYRVGSGRDRVTIDVHAEQGRGAETFRLEPGDVVRVFAIADRVRNTITVRGNVWSPGRFALEPGMMIADALRRAGGPKSDVYLRQVLVTRYRADSTPVQLRASLRDSTGAVVNDFALLEDDLVEVFSVGDFVSDQFVAVAGAVRSPGRFPYRQGMTLRDLILLADGLQESAYLREVEIARLPADRAGATTAVTLRVPLDSSYFFRRNVADAASAAADVPLMPYDNVLVMQQPNWELQRIVTISGEVAFPGPYALRTRGERLSDLIKRAGGFTADAYPEGTTFNRREGGVGRIAVDVPHALRQERSPENMILVDGDHINVPPRSFVVHVRGEVNAPNVVAYVPGAGMGYYIEQAGGVSRTGDKRAMFVTQPNGKRQTAGRFRPDPSPLAGSVITVPAAGPRTNYLQTIATFLTTIAGIISTVLVIQAATGS
jgi:polysaccharide export outer membrane protein